LPEPAMEWTFLPLPVLFLEPLLCRQLTLSPSRNRRREKLSALPMRPIVP
jgi:hypothetical protein